MDATRRRWAKKDRVRNKDANVPMPKDATFNIASMTKSMTSIALMQLFEEGRVMVSDPVGKHLPMLGNMRAR